MELSELYTEIITDYSKRKSHRHPLESPSVRREGLNPSCGDELTLELELKGDIIEKAAFTGDGCAISMASAAMMAEMIEGRSVSEARELAGTFLGMIKKTVAGEAELDALGDARALENISNMPARVKCAVLAWRTLGEALKDG